jgi:hypothetical protein
MGGFSLKTRRKDIPWKDARSKANSRLQKRASGCTRTHKLPFIYNNDRRIAGQRLPAAQMRGSDAKNLGGRKLFEAY